MKKFFRYLSLGLVVIFTVQAVLTLAVMNQLLNPDLYKSALDQSGIYQVTTSIVEQKVTDALVSLQKSVINEITDRTSQEPRLPFVKSIVITSLNSLVENQTGPFVTQISDKLKIEQGIQSFVESRIDRDIAWLNGSYEDPLLFQYIPNPEDIEKMKNSSLVEFTTQLTSQAMGIQSLPVCENNDQISQNILLAVRGNINDIKCTSPEIQPLLNSGLRNLVPTSTLQETERELQDSLDVFGIKKLLEDITQVSVFLVELKQDAIKLRTDLQAIQSSAYSLLLVTLPLLILGLLLSPKKRIKTAIVTYLIASGVMLSISLIYYTAIPSVVMVFVPLDQIQFGTGILTQQEGALLVASVRSAFIYIAQNVAMTALYISVVLTSVFALLLLAYKLFFPKNKKS